MHYMKLYNELLHDPKVQRMTFRHRWRMIECFLAASELNQGGLIGNVEELAWTCHASSEEFENDLTELASRGIMKLTEEGWSVVNFEKRQGRMSAAERMRRMRERNRKEEMSGLMPLDDDDAPVGELAEISVAFVNASGLPERQTGRWIEACKTLKNMGATPEDIAGAVQIATEKGYTLAGPWSLINFVGNLKRERKNKKPAVDATEIASEKW